MIGVNSLRLIEYLSPVLIIFGLPFLMVGYYKYRKQVKEVKSKENQTFYLLIFSDKKTKGF